MNKVKEKEIIPCSCPKGGIYSDGTVFSKMLNRFKKPYLRNGYLDTVIKEDGKWRNYRINRLVAEAFIPNPDNLPQVNHVDGIKTNDSAYNLEWVTDKQNKKHAWDTGLKIPSVQKKGEKHVGAKLTNEEAAMVRISKLSVRKLGEILGVHHSIIHGIRKGKRYPIEAKD